METEKITKQATPTYEQFPLKADLLAGMKDYGCLDSLPPQENILLPILESRDLYAQSQSSLQKSLAIIISALQRIESHKKDCQVLILMPTRELCRESIYRAQQIGKYMSNLSVVEVVGGTPVEPEKIKLQKGPSIVIGTPGRLLNAIETGSLELKGLKLLIVDEADELLGRGFQEQILKILKFVPADVRMAIISATMPGEVKDLADFSLRDPVRIVVGPSYVYMKDMMHFKVTVDKEEEKIEFLIDFYKKKIESRQSLIYCKKVQDLEKLVEALQKENFCCAGLHCGVPERERGGIIRGFLGSSEQILATVDREFFDKMGCTPSTVRLIIHYDIPEKKEEYQKSFGVLSRFSRRQTAINLVTPAEVLNVEKIEKFYGIEMMELPSDFMLV